MPALPALAAVARRFRFRHFFPFVDFLSPWPAPRIITTKGAGEMHFQVDLDPTHSVIRLTVIEEMVSLECAETCYQRLSQVTSSGGQYGAIYDLTIAKDTTTPTHMVRSRAAPR